MRGAPLDGVLVLDLSRVLAGPLATMVLADLGARVIKVEDPRGGDATRRWSPPAFDGEASYYLSCNRRKESVAADLATPDGAQLVRGLARRADVVVENFLPGTLESWDLSLDSLRAENPRLVACTISGYGEVGPLAGEPGFDLLAQGEAGLMSITGPDGGDPHKVGVALSDVLTGWAAATAIVAALRARDRDGVGCHVKTDLFSATLAGLVNVAQGCLVTGREAGRYGNGHPSIEPYRPFRARDGMFLVGAATDRQFAALCGEVLRRPELAGDPRFATNTARVENRVALVSVLGELLAEGDRAEWIARCRRAGVPAGPINGVLEALTSAQAAALGSVLTVERAGHEPLPTVHPPFRFTELEEPPATAPPRLDEDGESIRRLVAPSG